MKLNKGGSNMVNTAGIIATEILSNQRPEKPLLMHDYRASSSNNAVFETHSGLDFRGGSSYVVIAGRNEISQERINLNSLRLSSKDTPLIEYSRMLSYLILGDTHLDTISSFEVINDEQEKRGRKEGALKYYELIKNSFGLKSQEEIAKVMCISRQGLINRLAGAQPKKNNLKRDLKLSVLANKWHKAFLGKHNEQLDTKIFRGMSVRELLEIRDLDPDAVMYAGSLLSLNDD